MEQTSGEPQQKEHIPTPLKCPRCNSLDTKFRYYNNNSLTQPRYSCRTCKRQWTVGGNLRNIPIGGKSKSGKQTNDSSSRCDNSICPPLQPFGEQHQQISQSLEPMAGVVSQNFHTTMTKQTTNLPPPVFPQGPCYFNDEISCLDVIQSLIHPEPINQHVNVGNQFCSGGASMGIPQEWNIQPMPSQQAFHQQIPGYIEPHQTYKQVNGWPTSPLYNNSLVQPTWPMSSLTQDIPTNFDVPTSNTSLRNNFRGDTADAEMETNSVDVDEWLNFSDESS